MLSHPDPMAAVEERFSDEDFFNPDAFLASSPTMFDVQPLARSSGNVLALADLSAFPAVNSGGLVEVMGLHNQKGLNPLQLNDLHPAQLHLPDGFTWPHDDEGLGLAPPMPGSDAPKDDFLGGLDASEATSPEPTLPASLSAHGGSGRVKAKPSPLKKRPVDRATEAPKKSRRGRKSKALAEAEAVPDVDEDETKRERFLERNRVAASKCRQKKKAWTSQLETKARELTKERQLLTATVAVLKNELLELKCKCLEHSDCHCDRIRDYLTKTVAVMSPMSAVYANPALLDRRPSHTSASTLDGVDSAATSPQDTSALSCPPSPAFASDVESDIKTILKDSLGGSPAADDRKPLLN